MTWSNKAYSSFAKMFRRDDCFVDPSSHRIILKIEGLLDCRCLVSSWFLVPSECNERNITFLAHHDYYTLLISGSMVHRWPSGSHNGLFFLYVVPVALLCSYIEVQSLPKVFYSSVCSCQRDRKQPLCTVSSNFPQDQLDETARRPKSSKCFICFL